MYCSLNANFRYHELLEITLLKNDDDDSPSPYYATNMANMGVDI